MKLWSWTSAGKYSEQLSPVIAQTWIFCSMKESIKMAKMRALTRASPWAAWPGLSCCVPWTLDLCIASGVARSVSVSVFCTIKYKSRKIVCFFFLITAMPALRIFWVQVLAWLWVHSQVQSVLSHILCSQTNKIIHRYSMCCCHDKVFYLETGSVIYSVLKKTSILQL